MVKISILTPTVRKEGLDIVCSALKKQNFADYEWLIGSPFNPEIPEAVWIHDDFEGGFWSLNRIYNKMLKAAKGELIVSWQDWIWVPSNGLTQFWQSYEKTDSVVSGVGDQYEQVGRFGKPEVKIWSDPRKNDKNGSFYECFPNDAEWNWCAIPKKDLFKIGGMDEELDFLGFGGDQLQVGERLDAIGVKFYLDQTNESYTVRHGRESYGGENRWDGNHVLFNGKYDARIAQLKAAGLWPYLNYLQDDAIVAPHGRKDS